ncbi:ArsR/SmtB family transcription factor [Frigidibacter sp. ROC022]|uniref:ArsR/SmtB family transcription factor n=1 Tax=Frigidibacter sp. ROC022 TaxID=2971796 RepID=UPI00215B55D0|nr:metalloregulator ArsR/SmtB family transcription factor [Frigidibacter sp. ROC022]MCR8725058.1 metalloregulator ArsR/SmtB family transcription factor [Frigidibacter sp. ROC022]
MAEAPATHPAPAGIDIARMEASAARAAALLKALAHPQRLMLLCHLGQGERNVTELEALLDARQAAVSQQLARLREEGLVQARRDGKAVYYALADDNVRRVIATLYELYCAPC